MNERGQLWNSGSALDCGSAGQAIDLSPRASFIPDLISLAQVGPSPGYF